MKLVLRNVAGLLLKVGFNEPCFYTVNIEGKYERISINKLFTKQYLVTSNMFALYGACLAPTYEQVIDWLEQTYKIYVGFRPKNYIAPQGKVYWEIDCVHNSNYNLPNRLYVGEDKYELLNKFLEDTLEIIIQNK